MTKRLGQLVHSKRRALERFHINLNTDDIQNIVWMIQNQLGTHIKRCSSRRSTWVVEYAKQMFYVAYDKNTKTLATVMPLQYAVYDCLREANKHIWYCNPQKMNFYEKLDKVEKQIDMAYILFKEVIGS